MAKAGLEAALWDLIAKSKNISLSKMIGGTRNKIDVGVSIGIQSSVQELIKKIDSYLAEGYKRIKIKIAPGNDIQFVKAVRKEFPNILFQVDANSAYSLEDINLFKQLDEYNLLLLNNHLVMKTFTIIQNCSVRIENSNLS
jgi:o-succinylbenzoate synthase